MSKKQLLLLIFIFQLPFNYLFCQYPPENPDYNLVFDDEFHYTSKDTLANNWFSTWPWNQKSYIEMCGIQKVSNNDYLAYRTDNFKNCILDGNQLTLVSKKENYIGKVWDRWICKDSGNLQHCRKYPVDSLVPFKYTTGMLISKKQFKYGYFEVQCKLPAPHGLYELKGLGPNFWLFPVNPGMIDSINYSEIDIFEFAGEFDGFINYHTCNSHFRKCKPGNVPASQDTLIYQTRINENDYGHVEFSRKHTFGAEWTPQKIIFFIDKIPIYETNSLQTLYTRPELMPPMNIILDINHPTVNFCTLTDTLYTKFPYNFEIDYVRVYQTKEIKYPKEE